MLAKSKVSLDPNLTKILRVVAECIVFNIATLSPYSARAGALDLDWGTSFDQLFPVGNSGSSPFLGGLQSIYRVMVRANTLLYRTLNSKSDPHTRTFNAHEYRELWLQLDDLEQAIPQLYQERNLSADSIKLYKGKHKLAVLALRIQLCKIAKPSAPATDVEIGEYVSNAVAILKNLDIREHGNPALRWPLTILACAAYCDQDFVLITAKMQDLQSVIDPANGEKLSSAQVVMSRYPSMDVDVQSTLGTDCDGDCGLVQRIDLLLEPWKLRSQDSSFSWH